MDFNFEGHSCQFAHKTMAVELVIKQMFSFVICYRKNKRICNLL